MTIYQQFMNNAIGYKEYDFKARKERRIQEALNKNIAKENLILLRDIFYNNEQNFFLIYGTLLGAIREKDFIVHDTDTDIGIFEKDKEKFLKIIPQLMDAGFELIRTTEPDDLVTFMRHDEYIDIGIFRKEGNYYRYQNNFIKEEFLQEFIPLEFLETEFLIPKKYDELLRFNYGNWEKSIVDYPSLTGKGISKLLSHLQWQLFHSKMYSKIRPFVKRIYHK